MLGVILTVAMLQAPSIDRPLAPDAKWLPVQGNLSFTGLFGTSSALGVSGYLGYANGFGNELAPGLTAGPFWGAGALLGYGSVDLEVCASSTRCAWRWLAGPSVRAGWAWGAKGGTPIWPDTFVFAQLTPFIGGATVPSAPLVPAIRDTLFGARVDLGLNSVAWSRTFFKAVAAIVDSLRGSDAVTLGLAMLPLVLLNHFEISFEWSRGRHESNQFRAGFSAGMGF